MDGDARILEIHVREVQADAFRHTDAGAEEQGHHGHVADLRFLVERLLFLREAGAGFHMVQKLRDLVRVQPDNVFLVQLRHGDQLHGVVRDALAHVEIFVEAS